VVVAIVAVVLCSNQKPVEDATDGGDLSTISTRTLADAQMLAFGSTQVELADDDFEFFLLPIGSTADYRIEAVTEEEALSPLFYLYEDTPESLSAISVNILDSYVVSRLVAGTKYYLRLQELRGRPGIIHLVLSRE
jgi:hypothetical protein